MNTIKRAITLLLLAIPIASLSQVRYAVPDAYERVRVIMKSIAAHPGECACPYTLDRNGRMCGKRSAWYTAKNKKPICFFFEISGDQHLQQQKSRVTEQ